MLTKNAVKLEVNNAIHFSDSTYYSAFVIKCTYKIQNNCFIVARVQF